ncbi:hypothetical protein [Amycolatopsis sp. NPDC052450]|uniref:hypothetical protein n=1 Tax=Amycolatopsis sp. NPDC052450 TaxID=3363937 RepID=UPI0037C7E49E
MSPQLADNTVLIEAVSGRDYAEVFAAAAAWFSAPAQADVSVWGLNLDQQGRLYIESDDLIYLELFYQRFDKPRLVREVTE